MRPPVPCLLLIGLSLFVSASCYRWEPIAVEENYRWQGDSWKVRVTDTSARTWLLDHFEIRGDTLRGAGYSFETARDPYRRTVQPVAVPMDRVAAVERKERRARREAMLTVGLVAAGVLALFIAF